MTCIRRLFLGLAVTCVGAVHASQEAKAAHAAEQLPRYALNGNYFRIQRSALIQAALSKKFPSGLISIIRGYADGDDYTFKAGDGPITHLAFCDQGLLVVVDGVLKCFNPLTGACVDTVPGIQGPICALTARHNQALVSCGQEGHVLVLTGGRVAHYSHERLFKKGRPKSAVVYITPHGKPYANSHPDTQEYKAALCKSLCVHNVNNVLSLQKTGDVIEFKRNDDKKWQAEHKLARITALAALPEQSLVVTGNKHGGIVIRSATDLGAGSRQALRFTEARGGITHLALAQESSDVRLACLTDQGFVRLYDLTQYVKTRDASKIIQDNAIRIDCDPTCLAIAEHGQPLFAVGDFDGRVTVVCHERYSTNQNSSKICALM